MMLFLNARHEREIFKLDKNVQFCFFTAQEVLKLSVDKIDLYTNTNHKFVRQTTHFLVIFSFL